MPKPLEFSGVKIFVSFKLLLLYIVLFSSSDNEFLLFSIVLNLSILFFKIVFCGLGKFKFLFGILLLSKFK